MSLATKIEAYNKAFKALDNRADAIRNEMHSIANKLKKVTNVSEQVELLSKFTGVASEVLGLMSNKINASDDLIETYAKEHKDAAIKIQTVNDRIDKATEKYRAEKEVKLSNRLRRLEWE